MAFKIQLEGGQHIVADKSKPRLGADGKPTGRYESRVITKGGTFESDVDLGAREPTRYRTIGGDVTDANARIAELEKQLAEERAKRATASTATSADNPAVAPGGQVSSGFQKTSGAGQSTAMTAEAAAHGGNVSAPDQEGHPVRGGLHAEKEPEYDAMTADELRAHAKERHIELHGAKTKDDLIKAVRKKK
jgi:hypothetical protein